MMVLLPYIASTWRAAASHNVTARVGRTATDPDRILDLSKIEAARMELESTELDLANAIENELILVREGASRRGITLGRAIDKRGGSLWASI